MRNFVSFLWMMTAVLVVLKITNMIWWSWPLVLAPVLLLYGAQLAVWVLGVFILGLVMLWNHCARNTNKGK